MKATLIALALVAAPFVAQASDPVPSNPQADEGALIRKFDKDGDGRLSRQESNDAAQERANRRFDQLDRNKDGYITQDELDAARGAMRGKMREMRERMNERWQAADKDGDGALSRSEAEAGMPMLWRRFDQLDKNKDGKITRDEMMQGRRMNAPRPSATPPQ